MSNSLFIAYLLNIILASINAIKGNLAITLFHCSMIIFLAICDRRNDDEWN